MKNTNGPRLMLRIVSLGLFALPMLGHASGGGGAFMQHVSTDVGDVASLQRGARNFVNYCSGCHSAKYIRFSKLQEDLQLTEAQVVNNLMFAAKKTDELMTVNMPAADAERWFGQAPPDLTLVARSRGSDWVYSFLKSFYVDESTPTGTNNLVLPNASMPNVIWELQGQQAATFSDSTDADGNVVSHFGNPAYFEHFDAESEGTMSAAEFDGFVRDLVNFLDWAGTPEKLERKRLGVWVLIFLFVFLIFAYLLKQEIWKDIKK